MKLPGPQLLPVVFLEVHTPTDLVFCTEPDLWQSNTFEWVDHQVRCLAHWSCSLDPEPRVDQVVADLAELGTHTLTWFKPNGRDYGQRLIIRAGPKAYQWNFFDRPFPPAYEKLYPTGYAQLLQWPDHCEVFRYPNGKPSLPKEKVETLAAGKALCDLFFEQESSES